MCAVCASQLWPVPIQWKGGTSVNDFFESLEHIGWVSTIATTGWMYATFGVIHYFSLLVLVGTIAIVDLRVLGLAARSQTISEVADQFFPWMWVALVTALFSGFIMFLTDAGDFFPDIVFRVKMTVIFLALIFAIIVQRSIPKWDKETSISGGAKAIALISLLLWVGAILAGVDIAAISGLG
jgi:hypothetical protein